MDSDYAKDLDSRRSITRIVTYLDGAPVLYWSSTQKMVSLSMTEMEMNAVVTSVQDALFVRSIVESLGLKVKLPMKVLNYDHGEIDLIHNWSIVGHTGHIEVKQNFLRELKEAGIVDFEWISTYENEEDMFTKNLGGPEFNKHVEKLCGMDKYYRKKGDEKNGKRGRVSGT